MRATIIALALAFPAAADAALLPVLTAEPANPAAFKRLDLQGWDFTGSTTIGLRHSDEEGADVLDATYQPLVDGKATFWTTNWEGSITLVLEPPAGYEFTDVSQFGFRLPPTWVPSWEPLYAGSQLSFELTSHAWEYKTENSGFLRTFATGTGAGTSATGDYSTGFINHNIPEPWSLALALPGLVMLGRRRRRSTHRECTP